jgi:hypothetical protein
MADEFHSKIARTRSFVVLVYFLWEALWVLQNSWSSDLWTRRHRKYELRIIFMLRFELYFLMFWSSSQKLKIKMTFWNYYLEYSPANWMLHLKMNLNWKDYLRILKLFSKWHFEFFSTLSSITTDVGWDGHRRGGEETLAQGWRERHIKWGEPDKHRVKDRQS